MTKLGGAEAARNVRLDECAEVLPGFSVRGRLTHDPEGTHQVVLTRHLTDGEPYSYLPSHELRLTPHTSPDSYQVQSGDVLFMSRGTANRAWVITSVPENTIAPVSFYILRPKAGVDGGYLAWYLNQAPAQAAIAGIRTGAGAPIVQRQVFQALAVVLPTPARQRQIADLGVLMAREARLRGALDEATRREHLSIGTTIINQLRNHYA